MMPKLDPPPRIADERVTSAYRLSRKEKTFTPEKVRVRVAVDDGEVGPIRKDHAGLLSR